MGGLLIPEPIAPSMELLCERAVSVVWEVLARRKLVPDCRRFTVKAYQHFLWPGTIVCFLDMLVDREGFVEGKVATFTIQEDTVTRSEMLTVVKAEIDNIEADLRNPGG